MEPSLRKKKSWTCHEPEHMVDIMDVIDEGVEEIENILCCELYFVLYLFTFHIWDTHFDIGVVFIVLILMYKCV